MRQSDIELVAKSQKQALMEADSGMPREALAGLVDVPGRAMIVSGIRRCGKSTLLAQFLKQREKFLYFNFEDIRLAEFELRDFILLDNVVNQSGLKQLFFDEIQNVSGWEMFVRQKLNEGFKVAVTGSNATLLSRELGTKLTGRHITTELFPFSYREFLKFTGLRVGADSVREYLEKGGFPEYLTSGVDDVLRYLVDDIVYRDIVVRHGIRDASSVRRLLGYLLANTSRLLSPSKLTEIAGVKSPSTVLDYFSFFVDAYIIALVPRFSYSLKAQALAPKKLYVCDTGLVCSATTRLRGDWGHLLENMVFMELRRRCRDIFYFSDGRSECDFVEFAVGKACRLTQVCWELTRENEVREVGGLVAAMKFFGFNKGRIVTLGQHDKILQDSFEIDVVPVYSLTV